MAFSRLYATIYGASHISCQFCLTHLQGVLEGEVDPGVALGVLVAMVRALSSICLVPTLGVSQSMVVNHCNIVFKVVPDCTHQMFISTQKLGTNHWLL
jgi:hypothetical protein